MKLSLILALKSDKEFFVFKSLSLCFFLRCGPLDKIANLVTLKKYSLKLYSLCLVECSVTLNLFWRVSGTELVLTISFETLSFQI